MTFITDDNDFSGVEVTNINKYGVWLVNGDHELFISFTQFPQFQDASVRKLMNIEQLTPNRLHWPDLDIDLPVEALRCFPLMPKPLRSTARSSRQEKTEPPSRSKSNLHSDSPKRHPKNNQRSLEQSTIFPSIPRGPHAVGPIQDDQDGLAQSLD